MTRLAIGISTCPNDTYAFHGLLSGAVDVPGIELDFVLADVEELNGRLLGGTLDVAKISYHAALRADGSIAMLSAGSALGFGVGPVVLGSKRRAESRGPTRVLTPGALTTAALLWELFHAGEAQVAHVRFDQIPAALSQDRAELGVCIHEARFTWERWGVDWVEDLGQRWEHETKAPLPLGGIAARRDLGEELLARLDDGIRRSIDWAKQDRDGALRTMRAHAQELDDAALWQHVELYVTDDTYRLSDAARAAVRTLERRARAAGLLAAGPELVILGR